MKPLKSLFFLFLIVKAFAIDNSTTIAEALEKMNCSPSLTQCKRAMDALQDVVSYCTTNLVPNVDWCTPELASSNFYEQIGKCRFLAANGCGIPGGCVKIIEKCEHLRGFLLHTPDAWKDWCSSSKLFMSLDVALGLPLLMCSLKDLYAGNNFMNKEIHREPAWLLSYIFRNSWHVLNYSIRYNSLKEWVGTPYEEAEHLHINCLRNAAVFYSMSLACLLAGNLRQKEVSSMFLLSSSLFMFFGMATDLFNIDIFNKDLSG